MVDRVSAALLPLLLALVVGCATPPAPPAASPAAPRSPLEGTRALDGFVPLRWNETTGTMWLAVEAFDQDLLYVESLPAGLGSNDIGLDRSQLGRERVVRFVRSGPRVLLVAPNLAYRAEQGSPEERRAVEDSFARSVLFGFDVAEEEGGRVWVDATGFFLRDVHDVTGTLERSGQGRYSLDPKRCAFHLPMTRNFPDNTEVEVLLTFGGTDPGSEVRSVAPDPDSLSVRERHSFVRLPGPGYAPRAFDPRAGYYPIGYLDYSVPLGAPMQRQFLTRHRLQKTDPRAARSPVVEPIVYYLDPATPEPIRGALLEGARWWSRAFDAAGFVDAFRVEMLPADADPMDVRYNVIQWVHRSTRGWSYGSGVTDPRTGEILKGHVLLGSLRVRQDYLIATALLAPYEDGKPVPPDMERMALARLRQLAAHEVGHTLGLAHNYLASSADRASVMDYPHPLVELAADGTLDLEHAYATGIGAWDEVSIAYGYGQFPPGTDEARVLADILEDARRRGLSFLTDQDARPLGSAHPRTHLWDNGPDALDELERLLGVRAAALARFGQNAVAPGQPLATLEEALVPLYLLHRYQLEAAAKSLAGVEYAYALRGDGQKPPQPVPAAAQRRALALLLGALAPDALALPPEVLRLLPPRPEGFPRHRELFANRTGGTLDALAPAEAAAELTFRLLLDPDRAARLVQQHALDPELPGLEEVLAAVLDATWRTPAAEDYSGELRRAVDGVALARLIALTADPRALQAVRERCLVALGDLMNELRDPATAATGAQRAHHANAVWTLERFLRDPEEFTPPRRPEPPPGQPIGMSCDAG